MPGSGPELPGTDVLCTDGVITAVGAGLAARATPGCEVIDATGLTVTAGFVDAHRHVWQAPLRGAGPDLSLPGYLSEVLGTALPAMSPTDAGEATFLGARAALRAGVTTVFDFSNAADLSPAHAAAVMDAFERSGVRAVVGTASPARTSAGASGRVTGALAILGPEYDDFDTAAAQIRRGRELGVMVAAHAAGSCVRRLHDEGLLGPHLQLVHLNAVTTDDAKLLAGTGTAVVVTPAVEAAMGHGASAYARLASAGAHPAFGADVCVNTPPDLFEPLRDTLRTLRLASLAPRAGDLLGAVTADGARAVGLGGVVGTVETGMRADLLLLSGFGHLTGDRAGAVVACATAADVHSVLVDGRLVR
ncbi:amidohydrolase family protein [Dactylosporangium siamense]|uniref:Amidohydrolase n=1 Tax=Dactylosporangium siamense TaxID=685454 RepID=A0A919PGB7_9ACTN|nr:amidohydrolase family protein [Dactylosporangium siamense]GIG42726.1 amidohydrolase [Dactylosporangium siamense]